MKHMYLDLEFKFKNEVIKDEYVIETYIKKFPEYVILKLPAMAVYFEPKIQAAAEEYFGKEVKISYDSSIQIKFYTYREFMHRHKRILNEKIY